MVVVVEEGAVVRRHLRFRRPPTGGNHQDHSETPRMTEPRPSTSVEVTHGRDDDTGRPAARHFRQNPDTEPLSLRRCRYVVVATFVLVGVLPKVLPTRYAVGMGVRRLSISVPPEVEENIRVAAAGAGLSVSAWLAQVATHAAVLEDGRRAVSEYQAEHGTLSQGSRAVAREVLDELGVGQPVRRAAG